MRIPSYLPQNSISNKRMLGIQSQVSYSSNFAHKLVSDTVSFKSKLYIAHIPEAKAMELIRDMAVQICVGEKFHCDYLNPAKKELAKNGLMIKTTRMRDEYFARILVANRFLYEGSKMKFNKLVNPTDLGASLQSEDCSYLTSESPIAPKFLYEEVINATKIRPVKGLSKTHAQANLIESIHNRIPINSSRSLNPNLQYVEQLPTNFGVADGLIDSLRDIFPHPSDSAAIKIYSKKAVDILFPPTP